MEPQPLAVAPESPHLPVPSPMPVLASAFWQALLYGSRDALVSPTDANTAVRLVARELGKDLALAQFTESLRVNTLRKILDGCGAEVWQVMNKLWRAAPPSPDAPVPNEDQSHCSPGVEDCPPSMAGLAPGVPSGGL